METGAIVGSAVLFREYLRLQGYLDMALAAWVMKSQEVSRNNDSIAQTVVVAFPASFKLGTQPQETSGGVARLDS